MRVERHLSLSKKVFHFVDEKTKVRRGYNLLKFTLVSDRHETQKLIIEMGLNPCLLTEAGQPADWLTASEPERDRKEVLPLPLRRT